MDLIDAFYELNRLDEDEETNKFSSDKITETLNKVVTSIYNVTKNELNNLQKDFKNNMSVAKDVENSMYITLIQKYNKNFKLNLYNKVGKAIKDFYNYLNTLNNVNNSIKNNILNELSNINKFFKSSNNIFIHKPTNKNYYQLFEEELKIFIKPFINSILAIYQEIKKLF